jgi:hypothetical protein
MWRVTAFRRQVRPGTQTALCRVMYSHRSGTVRLTAESFRPSETSGVDVTLTEETRAFRAGIAEWAAGYSKRATMTAPAEVQNAASADLLRWCSEYSASTVGAHQLSSLNRRPMS